jgi:putative endonuclease
MDNGWYVYILRCGDGSLYTGIATDVERRLAEHRANKGAKYLRGRGPLKLVFEKRAGSRSQALIIEHKVKGLTRQEKEDLIHERDSETYKSLVQSDD